MFYFYTLERLYCYKKLNFDHSDLFALILKERCKVMNVRPLIEIYVNLFSCSSFADMLKLVSLDRSYIISVAVNGDMKISVKTLKQL